MAIRLTREIGHDDFGYSPADYRLMAEGFIAYQVARRNELYGLSHNAALDEIVRERILIGVQRRDLDKIYQDSTIDKTEYARALAGRVNLGRVEMQRDLRLWFRTDIEEWEYKRARRLQKWRPAA